ncbi:hypothetical protein A1O3_09517 [Capronia epimyces CBS 606.96]|uniref:Dynactin 2 n=1 Tax=Capronia epimyces CBS 606.96 TaxID=1182542 RepID=W9XN38_9EURO|nr:uncharacterized protein A1O3_09517 [Capronia epimyces CBS 606.96]EXJ78356.1 hypothetical protein A1O3_09517 [Capronia epimyces CBS 606.96]
MAASKKYAGLPDLDAAPEVYETPDLADDVSTAQTGTVRTWSPAPSDDDSRADLDRHPLDRDGARRRFEPSVVDARDVDFSDAIGGPRRSYRTRSSRRRRRIQENGAEELGDLSDSEDESLSRKLARLKREAEEVRLQLERRELDKDTDGDVKDSVEQQQPRQATADEEGGNVDDVEQLSRLLDTLSTKARPKSNITLEDEFLSTLDTQSRQRQRLTRKAAHPEQQDSPPTVSALPAVAAFSDRLGALEAALGISSTSANTPKSSILPTLEKLSIKISTLSNALALPDSQSAAQTTSSPPHTTPLLDSVSSKLKTLIAEADRLTNVRKQAMQSLSDLHETRMRQLVSATVHTNTRPRRGLSNASAANQAVADLAGPGDESLQIQSRLFLDEQSAKITALYQLLPSIQNLQPLLPVVLERLRTLSVIHAGAAEAKNSLDAVEKRQAEMRDEIRQWRDAVETVEKGMSELEEAMKGNVKVVGEMVSGLEQRAGTLEQGR